VQRGAGDADGLRFTRHRAGLRGRRENAGLGRRGARLLGNLYADALLFALRRLATGQRLAAAAALVGRAGRLAAAVGRPRRHVKRTAKDEQAKVPHRNPFRFSAFMLFVFNATLEVFQ
jgi:hypothetical protein